MHCINQSALEQIDSDDDDRWTRQREWFVDIDREARHPLRKLENDCLWLYFQAHDSINRRALRINGDIIWEHSDHPRGCHTYLVLVTIIEKNPDRRDPAIIRYHIEGYDEDVETLDEHSLRFTGTVSIAMRH